jgi:hypothetical protein
LSVVHKEKTPLTSSSRKRKGTRGGRRRGIFSSQQQQQRQRLFATTTGPSYLQSAERVTSNTQPKVKPAPRVEATISRELGLYDFDWHIEIILRRCIFGTFILSASTPYERRIKKPVCNSIQSLKGFNLKFCSRSAASLRSEPLSFVGLRKMTLTQQMIQYMSIFF